MTTDLMMSICSLHKERKGLVVLQPWDLSHGNSIIVQHSSVIRCWHPLNWYNCYSMTTGAINEKCGSDWSWQSSAGGTTRWLQDGQNLLSHEGCDLHGIIFVCELEHFEVLHTSEGMWNAGGLLSYLPNYFLTVCKQWTMMEHQTSLPCHNCLDIAQLTHTFQLPCQGRKDQFSQYCLI